MNQEYKQDFIQAGKYAGQVRQFGKELIKPGASYNEVVALIREKIRSLGALPAFPPQIALNDVAAHFLPTPNEDIVFSNEIIKLDIGICYRGAIGDCAVIAGEPCLADRRARNFAGVKRGQVASTPDALVKLRLQK